MIRHLILAASLCAATLTPAQAEGSLDERALEDNIFDRPLKFRHAGKRGVITYTGSNQVVVKTEDGKTEYGEWEMQGDKMCARMESDYDNQSCFQITRTSDELDETVKYRTTNGIQLSGDNF